MKLATKLGIATVGVALSFAAIGTQSAQAASVTFRPALSSGDNYTFGLDLAPGEELGAGTTWKILTLFKPITDSSAGSVVNNQGVTSLFGGVLTSAKFEALLQVTPANVTDFDVTLTSANNIGNGFGWDLTKVAPALIPSTTPITPSTSSSATVPEPMTVGGSLLAVGFGAWMKRKKAVAA
ncbi:MAG: PEP-CTERM sorting domain-containing protein [Gloeotrichia echinulata CP02]|jgi:hypothetical protein|nr:PEP-CTERM sorting domain-containing protein [Gloeotrichia echinulata DEX184]